AVAGPDPLQPHLLVPAVHAAPRVWVYGKRHVLVYAGVGPPHALRVRVLALPGFYAFELPHAPLAAALLLQVHQRRRPAVAPQRVAQPPAAQVVRARHHAGPDPLRHPYLAHEVA